MCSYLNISNFNVALMLALHAITISCFSQDYEVKEAQFNTEEADFSGAFNGKQFVFASTRAKTNLSFLADTAETFFTDLYVVEMNADGSFTKPELLKGNVNTLYNEGQATFSEDGNLMIYTGNLKQGRTNKFEKVEEYKLGLFIAERFKDSWMITAEFPYNSRDGKYSVAHPCLAENDTVLYFASNMPGGFGGSDLYRSYYRNNMWSAPENLGKSINSKGNEFFPFVNEYGILFFSTNARKDSEGMDIYYSTEIEGQFSEPVRLNNSINTEYDEFAYSEKKGHMVGTFSSNRNDGMDDIFFFSKYINNYNNCLDNVHPTLCYHIIDEELSGILDKGFEYRWNMGDGTVLYGNEADYCYKTYGVYNLSLDVVDTLTKQVFANVSALRLDIRKDEKPYIISHDTTYTTSAFECTINLNEFKGFEVEKVEWELSDGAQFQTNSFIHQFKEPGTYTVKCGLIGKHKNKLNPRTCIYKEIVCLAPLAGQTVPEKLACCDIQPREEVHLKRTSVMLDSLGNRLSPFYRLVIARSEQQLKPDDAIFEKVTEEISELKVDNGYEYIISKASQWELLIPKYKELKSLGYTDLRAEVFSEIEYRNSLQQTFRYLQPTDVKWPEHKTDSIKDILEYRVKLFSSKEKTPFEDLIFEKIAVEISEIKTDEGYTYVIEKAVAEAMLLDVLNEVKSLGFKEAEIVTMYAREWEQHLESKGFYRKVDSKNSEAFLYDETNNANSSGIVHTRNKEASSYKIVLMASEKRRQIFDPIFSKVELEITELNTDNGYLYVVADGTSAEELKDELMTLKSYGFESAYIKEFTATEFSRQTTAKGYAVRHSKARSSDSDYLYSVVLMQSDERIPFNHDHFSKVDVSISELTQEDGEGYEYSVVRSHNREAVLSELDKWKRKGYSDAYLDSATSVQYSSRLVKVGRYIAPRSAHLLNVEFSKLSDIKFEYNSAEIKPESFKNLNYIAAILLLEEDFNLRLNAHTCNIGGEQYNQGLSEKRAESVMNYLAEKGIPRERMFPKGYGQKMPISANETEEGRKNNRRVEFVIVYNTRVTP